MLQNAPFYWGSVRKVVESFGVVFSDLHIVRTKTDGTVYQTIQVPCEYGPKEKWYIRNTQNPMPGTDDQIEMVLPRISYEMKGWQYDSLRKLTSTGRTVQAITNNRSVLKAQFNPVPYNFSFDLNIMAKNVEDGLMIIEQILPFFGPDYTISVNDMPELNLEKDIVILHNGSVEVDDTWEGNFDRRTIIWSMNFTVKAYLYPPVKLTTVNLQTDIRYQVDGNATTLGGGVLPSHSLTSNPPTADATNVSQVSETLTDKTVVLVCVPTTTTLSGGESQVFTVTVVNATNMVFTADVPVTSQTGNDTYSSDQVHGTFQYDAGTGLRTTQETITIKFVSVQDTRQSTTVTLVLNP